MRLAKALPCTTLGVTFAITQTIGSFSCRLSADYLYVCFLPAAICFPVLIMLLFLICTIIIPRMSFTREELAVLDGPTASSFVSKCPSSLHVLFIHSSYY